MIYPHKSTLSSDEDNRSKNLPIVQLLTSPVPLFVDLSLYYPKQRPPETGKSGTPRAVFHSEAERKAARLLHNKEYARRNKDVLKLKRKAKLEDKKKKLQAMQGIL